MNTDSSICVFQAICVSEMVCRSAKHLFHRYMQNTDPTNIAAAVSHFLNCLLSSCSLPTSSPYSPDAPSVSRSSSKKKNKKSKGRHGNNTAGELSRNITLPIMIVDLSYPQYSDTVILVILMVLSYLCTMTF